MSREQLYVTMLDLSIIIVNWNSVNYLRKCLASIYTFTKDIEFEVIVVDNASADKCGEMISKEFKKVLFIQSEENLGFAGANNVGFSRSSGRNVLFLNPDTELVSNSLAVMCRYLDSFPGVGVVGCTLLNTDLTFQLNSVLFFPRIMNQLIDSDLVIKAGLKSLLKDKNAIPWNNMRVYNVDVVSGACLMTGRHVFEKAHYFCLDYFLYSEELDLCYQAKKLNYETHYLQQLEIIHHEGGSSNKIKTSFYSVIMQRRALCLFFLKTKGANYAKVYKATLLLTSVIRLAVLLGAFPLLFTAKKTAWINSFKKHKAIFTWAGKPGFLPPPRK